MSGYCHVCGKMYKHYKAHVKTQKHENNLMMVKPKTSSPAPKVGLKTRCFLFWKKYGDVIVKDVMKHIFSLVSLMTRDVWWYYNTKYSQTGGIFLELQDAIDFIENVDGNVFSNGFIEEIEVSERD